MSWRNTRRPLKKAHLEQKDDVEQSSSMPPALDDQIIEKHKKLKAEQADLKAGINLLKLHNAALKIETQYLESTMRRLDKKNQEKKLFNNSIKSRLFDSAQQTLHAQKPDTFPNKFLTGVFKPFADDDPDFKERCLEIDNELEKMMQQLCDHACLAFEPCFQEVIDQKLHDLRKKIKNKYEPKLAKLEQTQVSNMKIMRSKVFESLEQFLNDNCKDKNYIKSYLKQLQTLYDETTDQL